MKTVLSIQSSVAYGHVGNSAAVFPMQRRGIDVWPVSTVHFSNNTSYPTTRGPLLTAEDIADVVTGIDELGVLGRVDAVLSGYPGTVEVGAEILVAVDLVRRRNPRALYCCDPVLGGFERGFFVRPGVPEFLRDQVIPKADIVTPNLFELNYLTSREAGSLDAVLTAAQELRDRGPEVVVVTSVPNPGPTAGDTGREIGLVTVTGEGAWLVTTPELSREFMGSGDLTSAMFLTSILLGDTAADSLARTAEIVYGVLHCTAGLGQRELQLVAAQDEIVAPGNQFTARRVG